MKTVGDEDTRHGDAGGRRFRDDQRHERRSRAASSRTSRASPATRSGPLASPELLVIVDHPLQRSGTDANVPLRGVTPRAFQVHTNVKIVEGRAFEPGRNEIVAGRAASRQFTDLTIGSTVKWGENQWTGGRHLRGRRIGGRVRAVVRRQGAAAGLPPRQHLPVGHPAARLARFVRSAQGRADDRSAAERARRSASRSTTSGSRRRCRPSSARSAVAIAGLMGIGAVFGAVNTMYNAVASRSREIATLRALGFGSLPVVVSVLAEAVALSVDRRGHRRRCSRGRRSTATRPRR